MAGAVADTPAVAPMHTFHLGQHSYWMRGVTATEAAFKTLPWRRRLVDCFAADVSVCERMATDRFSFSTLCPIGTTDSNVSGAVFTFDTDEYVGGSIDHLPRKVVIKVSSYRLNRHSRRGLFTGSDVVLDANDPSNIEMRALLLCRDLVLTGACPHIALLYRYFVAPDLMRLEHPLTNRRRLLSPLRQHLLCAPPEIRREVMVLTVEFASHGSVRYWRAEHARSEEEWRVVLFQVVYTLAVLQHRFPGFRHNDLHQANVLLDRIANRPSRFFGYSIFGLRFWLPARGVSVRLFDFDWTFAPGILENGKARSATTRQMRMDEPCDRFDLHRFLNHVLQSTRGALPNAIADMIRRVYPAEFLGHTTSVLTDYRIAPGVDTSGLPTPRELLSDPIFETFRAPPAARATVESYAYPAPGADGIP
jgi:hypothetical protein